MNPSTRIITATTLALTATLFAAPGESQTDRQAQAFRSSVAQEALQKESASVQGTLEVLRKEMAQYPVAAEERALVERALQNLGSLSENEMTRAIATLREASKAGDVAEQSGKLNSAARDQQAINLQLSRLAVQLKLRQSLAALVPVLSETIQRQTAASRETARLAALPPREAKKDNARNAANAAAEQKAIGEKLAQFLASATNLGTELDPATRAPLEKMLKVAAERQVAARIEEASPALAASSWEAGAAVQKQIEDGMNAMLAAMETQFTARERLEKMAGEIGEIARQQSEVSNAPIDPKKGFPVSVRNQQAELAARTAALGEKLAALNQEAAKPLAEAASAMEKSTAGMTEKSAEKPALAEHQAEAARQLEAAKAGLEKQLAQLPPDGTPPGTPEAAAALAKIKSETERAAAMQSELAQSPPGANPAADAKRALLEKGVEALQQKAAGLAPDAAAALGEAAAQMAQPGAPAQAEAAQSLSKAAAQMGEQLARMNGVSPEQMAMAKLEGQVQAAAGAAQKAANSPGTNPSQTASQMDAAGKMTAAAEAAARQAGASPAAQQALAAASAALAQAQSAASQGQMAGAKAAAAQAKAALDSARSALAQARQNSAANAAKSAAASMPANQKSAGNPSRNGGRDSGPTGGYIPGSGEGFGGPAQALGGLSAHEREAVTQLQNEKTPAEFTPAVRQYFKNLADGAGN